MIIAVDFDGTIVEHAYPSIGREIPGAFDCLRQFVADGHRLILWTTREGKLLEEAVRYCRNHDLEFYAVNSDTPGTLLEARSRKLATPNVYIDDRNIGGLPEWPVIYEMVSEHLTFQELTDKVVEEGGSLDIVSSSFGGRKRRKKAKRNALQRLIDRCFEARDKF